MQPARSLLSATALLFCLPVRGDAATSDWLSAPKPEFPSSALKAGSEGSVKLRAVLAKDGHVTSTIISRSSGNSILDRTAQQAVSKWRMKPSAITPSDARQGRETIVEFKQEALVAAIYPDRQAYFGTPDHILKKSTAWIFAPFPSYPLSEREQHHTGTVLMKVTIGGDGRVASAQVLRSSGYSALDESAVKAVRLWRAHNKFAGKQGVFPIHFEMGRRRH
jgi:TonB family protein